MEIFYSNKPTIVHAYMCINMWKILIFPPYIHFQFINRPNIFFFWKEHMHFRLQHLEIMLFLFTLKLQFVLFHFLNFISFHRLTKLFFKLEKDLVDSQHHLQGYDDCTTCHTLYYYWKQTLNLLRQAI